MRPLIKRVLQLWCVVFVVAVYLVVWTGKVKLQGISVSVSPARKYQPAPKWKELKPGPITIKLPEISKLKLDTLKDAEDDLRRQVDLISFFQPESEDDWGILQSARMIDDVVIEVPRVYWVMPEYFFFMHIPKTAGFTFNNILINSVYNVVRKDSLLKPMKDRYRYCNEYCGCNEGYSTLPPPPRPQT